MKKSKFLSGLSAKLALAAVALTTAVFTSCSNEDIEVNVTPVNAQAVITPVVFANGTDVTASATITFSDNSNGKYEATTIEAKTVTVTATYNGMTGSSSVNIPSLTAGKYWSQTVVITLNYGTENFDNQKVEGSTVTVKEVKTDTKIHDNPSDYWYEVPITYTQTTGKKVVESQMNVANDELKEFINSQNVAQTTKTVTEEHPVFAHSRLEVYINTITTRTTYNVTLKTRAGETILATYTVEEVNTEVQAKSDAQIPGHGHAPAGHGHGHAHGGSSNAGGGIIFAD